MRTVAHFTNYLFASLFIVVFGFANPVKAADADPLRPVDASSPRATLRGFAAITDKAYLGMTDLLNSNAASNRLYLNSEERHRQIELMSGGMKAVQFLDTSRITPVLKDSIGVERVLQLKEILDRIELPAFDAVPDRDAVARSSVKRWRLTGTEIDVVLIENGPHTGDWLVSADTVDRLPEFYRRVEDLPYKPGLARQLADTYRALSSNRTPTIYQAYSGSPLGLEAIVPTRWMLSLPGWSKARIAGVALWQWFGFVLGIAGGVLLVFGCHRLGRRLGHSRGDQAGPGWQALLTPLGIIIAAGLLVPLISAVFHIGGSPRIVAAFLQTIALYLSAAWLAVIGEPHAQPDQLTVQAASLQMFRSRDRVSEQAIGHRIRVGSSEGVVEDVGYRSVRIRTADNSLISIPNDTVVNTTVENLTLRTMFRQRLLVQVTYDTPRDKLEALADGIRQLTAGHPMTNKNNFHVRFNDFGESSLNILVSST